VGAVELLTRTFVVVGDQAKVKSALCVSQHLLRMRGAVCLSRLNNILLIK
jgi:hypothetical protein